MRKAIKCVCAVNHVRIRISWRALGAYQFPGPTSDPVNKSECLRAGPAHREFKAPSDWEVRPGLRLATVKAVPVEGEFSKR